MKGGHNECKMASFNTRLTFVISSFNSSNGSIVSRVTLNAAVQAAVIRIRELLGCRDVIRSIPTQRTGHGGNGPLSITRATSQSDHDRKEPPKRSAKPFMPRIGFCSTFKTISKTGLMPSWIDPRLVSASGELPLG